MSGKFPILPSPIKTISSPVISSSPTIMPRPTTPVQTSVEQITPMAPMKQQSMSVGPISPIPFVIPQTTSPRPLSPTNISIPKIEPINVVCKQIVKEDMFPGMKVLNKVFIRNDNGNIEYYLTKILGKCGKTFYIHMNVEDKLQQNEIYNYYTVNIIDKTPSSIKDYLITNIEEGYVVEYGKNIHVLYNDKIGKKIIERIVNNSNLADVKLPLIYPLFNMTTFIKNPEFISKNIDRLYLIIKDYYYNIEMSKYKNLQNVYLSISETVDKLRRTQDGYMHKFAEVSAKISKIRTSEIDEIKKEVYANNIYKKEEKFMDIYNYSYEIEQYTMEMERLKKKMEQLTENINLISVNYDKVYGI